MDLKTYLESRNFDKVEFAALIGVSPRTIFYYLARKKCPSLKVALKIEEITKGKVRNEDLLAYWSEGALGNYLSPCTDLDHVTDSIRYVSGRTNKKEKSNG
jgi:DNA-binding transcriptional regulator YdaS (Cro superfamily)